MAFNLQGGYGAGAGADMLQQILKQKALEFAQAEQIRVADERTKQEAARIAQEGERLKGDAAQRDLVNRSLIDSRNTAMEKTRLEEAAKQAEATKQGTLGTLRGAMTASQNLAGTADPTGASATRGALRVAMASGGAEQKDIPQEPKSETKPVMRINPRTGQMENIGTAPSDAHFVTEPSPPAPQTPNFSIQPVTNPDGTPGIARVNTRTGDVIPVTFGAGVTAGRTPAAVVGKQEDRKRAIGGLDQLDAAITAAQDFVGPGAGRISTIEQMVGNPDPKLQALGTKMLMAKMIVDAGIGGQRAAASPQLLARWDNLFSQKLTPEALRATVTAMREMLNAGQAAPTDGKTPPKNQIRYDMNGQVIK